MPASGSSSAGPTSRGRSHSTSPAERLVRELTGASALGWSTCRNPARLAREALQTAPSPRNPLICCKDSPRYVRAAPPVAPLTAARGRRYMRRRSARVAASAALATIGSLTLAGAVLADDSPPANLGNGLSRLVQPPGPTAGGF